MYYDGEWKSNISICDGFLIDSGYTYLIGTIYKILFVHVYKL